ncbi:MAG: response regulator transcription factor [Caldilineaceae bacterium]
MKTTPKQLDDCPIHVLIVDDHPMMRKGLRSFLEVTRGLECIGEAESGEEAIEFCVQLGPQVVIMDLMMPGMGGVAATRVLRERCPKTHVVALTSFAEPHLVQEAVNAGAIGYLLKNVSASELADAVFAAAAGRTMMGPEAVQALVEIASDPRPIGSDLTQREREILALLVTGMTNHEIAQQMSISEATVRFHVGNILGKLEVGNRTEAAQVAFKHRLVEP